MACTLRIKKCCKKLDSNFSNFKINLQCVTINNFKISELRIKGLTKFRK